MIDGLPAVTQRAVFEVSLWTLQLVLHSPRHVGGNIPLHRDARAESGG